MMRRLPPLPRRVHGPAGAVTVQRVVRPRDDHGVDCWGTFDHTTRTIQIARGAPRFKQWLTLYHELAHVALQDAGVENLLRPATVEAVCDAFAAARMRERFG